MNILFVVPKYHYGGAEKQAIELAKNVLQFDNKVTILDFELKKKLKIDGLDIIGFGEKIFFQNEKSNIKRNLKRIGGLIKLVKLIKKNNYDYVIIFNKLFLPIVLFNYKSKIVFSVREFDRKYFKGGYKYLLSRCNILMSNNYPSYLYLKNFKDESYFINNIINILKTSENQAIKNKEYLMISNIAKHKNIELAIEVFKELSEKGYKLKIAGNISDEKYFEKIKKSIEDEKYITYLGFLNKEELEKEYEKAEGIIHTSLKEGTANAILDAIKNKKPFVSLDIPENIYLVGEIRDYLASDKEEFIQKIENINNNLNNNRRKIEENSNYLLKKIEKLFSKENAIKFNEILLKKLEEK